MIGIISYKDLEKWDYIFPPKVERIVENVSYPQDNVRGGWFELITNAQPHRINQHVRTKIIEDNSGCYIILLGNLQNETKALKLVLDNYSHLNKRTKDVRFFMPGFIVGTDGLVGKKALSHKEQFEFFQDGFEETIDWLEEGNGNYQYSEGMDMVILPYEKVNGIMTYDFEHMLYYDLDKLLNEDKNILNFIKSGVMIVKQKMNYEKTRAFLEGAKNDLKQKKSHKVFIAGSKRLWQERDAIRSAFSQLTIKGNVLFETWTYEDFERTFTDGGRQKDYNDFIINDADTIIFVLNETVGGITLDEFNIALSSFKHSNHPNILVYSQKFDNKGINLDILNIKNEINNYHQYYTEYYNIDDLKVQIKEDFYKISLE